MQEGRSKSPRPAQRLLGAAAYERASGRGERLIAWSETVGFATAGLGTVVPAAVRAVVLVVVLAVVLAVVVARIVLGTTAALGSGRSRSRAWLTTGSRAEGIGSGPGASGATASTSVMPASDIGSGRQARSRFGEAIGRAC